jgi:hypothetical protein
MLLSLVTIRGCIQKFPDRVDKDINYNNNNKHLLRRNTKSYSGKTRQTDSQNSDTTALIGIELYHLQFSLQTASPETFGYTIVGTTVGKTEGKRQHGRPGRRWENNIKVDLKEIEGEFVDWIHLAQDGAQWVPAVDMVMNLRLP